MTDKNYHPIVNKSTVLASVTANSTLKKTVRNSVLFWIRYQLPVCISKCAM